MSVDGPALEIPGDGPNRILLLQGPVGPFFARLRHALQARGHVVDHYLFNMGDVLFGKGTGSHTFEGDATQWDNHVEGLFDTYDYRVIVLFGCFRPIHAIVMARATALSIPVLCLEEGYVRPGFVAAEWGGNNAASPFANTPMEVFLERPLPTIPPRWQGRSYNRLIWLGFRYFFVRMIGYRPFERVPYHKKRHSVLESLLWTRSLYRKIIHWPRNRRRIERLSSRFAGRFYMLPLQVHDDQQLLSCGHGWTNEALVEAAVRSFARHAPPSHRLVVKAHPMDRGHTSIERHLRTVATAAGCQDRVIYLDDGVMGELAKICSGMLTINSSSALSALLHGVPVGVLGDAVFRRQGLVTCLDTIEDIDRFWTDAQAAPENLAHGFRTWLMAHTQVPGDFYDDDGIKIAISHIVEMLEEEPTLSGEPAWRNSRYAAKK